MSELLEKILSSENMNAAYKRVCANKGVGGVDDVTVVCNKIIMLNNYQITMYKF